MVLPQVLAKRLQNLLRTEHSVAVQAQLQKQLDKIIWTGVHPEVNSPMVGHCGRWQGITTIPHECVVCGTMLLLKV